jgi:hypothetical protein
MKKLVLVEFLYRHKPTYVASTDEKEEFKQYRLVVVRSEQDDTEEQLLKKAVDIFISTFSNYFPYSELIYVQPFPTIGE